MKRGVKRFALSTVTRIWGDQEGRVVVPVLTGPAQGLRFRLNLQAETEPAYFFGTYESLRVRRIA